MASVRSHRNIELMTYSEVTGVSGFVGNFKVKITQKPRHVDMGKCTGCGTCQEKCPTKLDNAFDAGLGKRKAIYTPFAQAVPNVPVIDTEHCMYFQKGKCGICKKLCEAKAIDYEQKEKNIEVEVGNIIVTTGFNTFNPEVIYQLGYGRFDNIFTGIQFERMSNSSGPTDGKILMKDGSSPKSIAILHCIGSRDANYHKYCSRVCCMYSLKFAHQIREKLPEATVYQLYIDMRCPGSNYEEFYERLQEEGVNFIRGKAGEITNIPETPEEKGKLMIMVEDTLIRRKRRLAVDMVVLSTALEPRADAENIARTFSLSRKADGFFLEKHPKLDPVATTTEGVFIAGCCQGPKDIPDTVAQASAAAARVLSMISKGSVEIESAIAYIDEELCSGCKVCVDLCPYQAISFDEEKKVSQVNEALCKGCGTCVAACPAGAIIGNHFTSEEIMAEIEGVLS
jgi:heterodisulfide reductase subunit A2